MPGLMTNGAADAEFVLERIIKLARWRFLGLVASSRVLHLQNAVGPA
jgi:hypothetical protein